MMTFCELLRSEQREMWEFLRRSGVPADRMIMLERAIHEILKSNRCSYHEAICVLSSALAHYSHIAEQAAAKHGTM